MSWYDPYDENDDDEKPSQYLAARKRGKPLGHDAPHIPNKAERQELARIMQASGMTEEEVREDIVHRRSLAKASKSKSTPKGGRLEHDLKMARRREARYLKVEVWDPKVDEAMNTKDWRGSTPIQRIRRSHGLYF